MHVTLIFEQGVFHGVCHPQIPGSHWKVQVDQRWGVGPCWCVGGPGL